MTAPTFYASPDMEARDAGHGWTISEGGVAEVMAAGDHPDGPRLKQASRTGSARFTATRDWEQADSFLRHGWTEGTEKIDDIRATILGATGWGVFPEAEHDVEGALVDVGAYVAGEPECMMRFVDQPAKRNGGLVRVVIENCVQYDINAEAMLQQGAALFALVDTLERGGKSVEIVATSSNYERRKGHVCAVTLKHQGGHIDPNVLAYCVGHPSFFRRHVFAVWERQSLAMRKHFGWHDDHGYGMVSVLPDHLRESIVGVGGLYIPAITDNRAFDTPAKCREWIKARCAEQGVGLEMAG